MISASGSIPLAVTAAKLGIIDFLRKPLEPEQLSQAVNNSLAGAVEPWHFIDGTEWLIGQSEAAQTFLAELKKIALVNQDFVLVAERGVDQVKVAALVQANSFLSQRRFVVLDLASFSGEAQEARFWTSLQELLALPEISSLVATEDRCGTVFLANFDRLDQGFKLSLLNFLSHRPARIDKSCRVIIGSLNRPAGRLDLPVLEVPPLRRRRSDLPQLLNYFLGQAAVDFDKPLEFFSLTLWPLLDNYQWPGNYQELACLVKQAALAAADSQLSESNWPISFGEFLTAAVEENIARSAKLAMASRVAEKSFYNVLVKKTDQDLSAAAQFVDLGRQALTDRLDDLAG
jgi:DNA-binding NtrC family response regulator